LFDVTRYPSIITRLGQDVKRAIVGFLSVMVRNVSVIMYSCTFPLYYKVLFKKQHTTNITLRKNYKVNASSYRLQSVLVGFVKRVFGFDK